MDTALKLSVFFEKYFAPVFLCDARPRTFKAYAETLNHWRRFTIDPPIENIRTLTLAVFKASLREIVAASTVNKHLRHINAMLAKAGPPGPRNRDALAIVERTPWAKPFRVDRKRPRLISEGIVSAVYLAAGVARFPVLDWCSACSWWRALICTAVTSGFRRGAFLALLWLDIDVVEKLISLPSSIDKCHADREKPLNSVTIRHLLEIRGDDERVFPFDHTDKTWYKQWHAIQDAADIPHDQHIKLHDLKRFAGTRYAATSSPWVVQQMLDHSSIETSRYYVNAAEQCREAVDNFPMPDCFLVNTEGG
ncbi:MAG: site-specific integrase [Planctomycetes bacterium]|nr:site-specific integrase [Planctomycetota bacterium]MBU4400096.1 site-specific integrase [Planctomycetota bacterium]MCG2682237.1 site-specific integrase [Planctomycetales bacterium]